MFESLRPPPEKRRFTSPVIERVLIETQNKIADPELAWLFGNCFPNTLDTTVTFDEANNDTFIITGDIDAMWLRDSTNQVWPYLPYAKECPRLAAMLRGLIRRQAACVLLDPYANAFYKDPTKISPWKSDHTEMKPGIHERKYELDSLASVLRLAVGYYEATRDRTPFDDHFQSAAKLIVQTVENEQRGSKEQPYPLAYSFQRTTQSTTETLALEGLGNPFGRCGLSRSPFRPSDDAAIFQYLIPSNAMMAIMLEQATPLIKVVWKMRIELLVSEMKQALTKHAIIAHEEHGSIYAYEIDGYSSFHCMDDANVPNLLSLPYLGFCKVDDPIYQNTRRFCLSRFNPYFATGPAAPEGALGGPHIGTSWVWPLGIITRAITSTEDKEILTCLYRLKKSHAGKGFMHEAFRVDNAEKYTRDWFAWANTYFGELILHLLHTRPHLLAYPFT